MKDSLLKTEHTTDRLIYKHGVVSAQKEDRPHPASHGVYPVTTARTKYRVHKTVHKFNSHNSKCNMEKLYLLWRKWLVDFNRRYSILYYYYYYYYYFILFYFILLWRN